MSPSQTYSAEEYQRLLKIVEDARTESEQLAQHMTVINEISLEINQTLDRDTILDLIAKKAIWLFNFDHLSLCLNDQTDNSIWTVHRLVGDEISTKPIDIYQEAAIVSVIHSRQAIELDADHQSTLFSGLSSVMIVPLASRGEVIGTMQFGCKQAHHLNYNETHLIYMLSLQVGSALYNARLVQRLEDTQEQLQRTIEDLDAYNHTIAHDLKSPLNSVALANQLIDKALYYDASPDIQRYIETIALSSDQMHRMIEQLLALSRLRHADEVLQGVDMNQVMAAALNRFKLMLDHSPITIHIGEDLIPVYAHPQWMEEIIANLVSNAIKYIGDHNPQPAIWIEAMSSGDVVRYSVRDNGIGIQEKDQQHLFEMFSRTANTESIEGLGLGLSIIRRIIQRLNGKFGLESTYGEGSTFWFEVARYQEMDCEARIEII